MSPGPTVRLQQTRTRSVVPCFRAASSLGAQGCAARVHDMHACVATCVGRLCAAEGGGGRRVLTRARARRFLAETNQTCVQPSPDGMQGLLVGDVFFREYMVEFDMQDESRPVIGIARGRPRFYKAAVELVD